MTQQNLQQLEIEQKQKVFTIQQDGSLVENKEIAQGVDMSEHRDAWLIEITGGPNTECENCPNYDFDNLTEYYWPALIGGVQAYTNESQIDYVGFSNGCRTALGSLEKWQADGKDDAGYYVNDSGEWVLTDMDANVVNTFVGVGCPGAFEGERTSVSGVMDLFGQYPVKNLQRDGVIHASLEQIIKSALNIEIFGTTIYDIRSLGDGSGKISRNLLSDYIFSVESENDSQLGNFSVENSLILHSYYFGHLDYDDLVVTGTDQREVYANIDSFNKKRIRIPGYSHFNFPDSKIAKFFVKKFLNNESFLDSENIFIMEETQ